MVLTKQTLVETVSVYHKNNDHLTNAAKELGIASSTMHHRLEVAGEFGLIDREFLVPPVDPMVIKELPSAEDPLPTIEDIATQLSVTLRRRAAPLSELVTACCVPLGTVLDALDFLSGKGVNVLRIGDSFMIPNDQNPGYVDGPVVELVSRKDNTFLFGAFSDLHAASKHARWDVRTDLIKRCEAAGAQAIFDAGNWIDGESRFNKYDLEVIGMHQQCELLAEKHPITEIPIYAVAGDDHEGWYAQREGVNIGLYAQNIMRNAGHNWHDLGFMEAHVLLKNSNTGKTATMAVAHPGGGSAYALSYALQKILESLEGGEKPAVGLYGHFHKLWAGNIRNVWVISTGTAQDQTPFMRKKRLEAHVGGAIVELEQDPETGAIIACTPKLIRYFNRSFYAGSGRWSHHGNVVQLDRSINAGR
jgi:hypothetical protein